MDRCRKCGFPLKGMLARLFAGLLGCRSAKDGSGLCQRCAPGSKAGSRTPDGSASSKGAYTCRICERTMEESAALTHVKTEEYLLELIRKDHPEWREHDAMCPKCVDYYRELIKKGKI